MALGYAFTYVLILLIASPVLWIGWWLIAEVGQAQPAPVARRGGRVARVR